MRSGCDSSVSKKPGNYHPYEATRSGIVNLSFQEGEVARESRGRFPFNQKSRKISVSSTSLP